MYLVLIIVCRKQQEEKPLSIYEVNYSGQTSTLYFCRLGSSVKNANGDWMWIVILGAEIVLTFPC
jgi:hypothetical protein